MIASNTPPGLLRARRPGFSFARWNDHSKDEYADYLEHLRSQVVPLSPGRILGTDIDGDMVEKCRRNLERVGLGGVVAVKQVSIADFGRPEDLAQGSSVVICNPPYGQRLGALKGLEGTYEELGQLLKRCFAGDRAAFIVGEDAPHRCIGLKPSSSFPLRNGSIPCRLIQMDIYAPRPTDT